MSSRMMETPHNAGETVETVEAARRRSHTQLRQGVNERNARFLNSPCRLLASQAPAGFSGNESATPAAGIGHLPLWPGRVTAIGDENSEVLPLASVAVATIWSPGAGKTAGLNTTFSAPCGVV